MEYATLLRPRSRRSLPLIGVAALLAAAATLVTYVAVAEHRAADSTLAQARQFEARRKPALTPRPSRGAVETQRRWSLLHAELSFAWYPVFRALEESSNPDIELLEFLPDKAGRRIVLRGEARTQEALLSYVKTLSSQPAFSELHLARQKTLAKPGMKVISFEIRSLIAPL